MKICPEQVQQKKKQIFLLEIQLDTLVFLLKNQPSQLSDVLNCSHDLLTFYMKANQEAPNRQAVQSYWLLPDNTLSIFRLRVRPKGVGTENAVHLPFQIRLYSRLAVQPTLAIGYTIDVVRIVHRGYVRRKLVRSLTVWMNRTLG